MQEARKRFDKASLIYDQVLSWIFSILNMFVFLHSYDHIHFFVFDQSHQAA